MRFLLFITTVLMPPAGLAIFILYLVKSMNQSCQNPLMLRHQIAKLCVYTLVMTSFLQVCTYIYVATEGSKIVYFLETIY